MQRSRPFIRFTSMILTLMIDEQDTEFLYRFSQDGQNQGAIELVNSGLPDDLRCRIRSFYLRYPYGDLSSACLDNGIRIVSEIAAFFGPEKEVGYSGCAPACSCGRRWLQLRMRMSEATDTAWDLEGLVRKTVPSPLRPGYWDAVCDHCPLPADWERVLNLWGCRRKTQHSENETVAVLCEHRWA